MGGHFSEVSAHLSWWPFVHARQKIYFSHSLWSGGGTPKQTHHLPHFARQNEPDESKNSAVAHTKRKAQPPDRCCETGRRSCLPIGLTLRPKGRTVTISQHRPACTGLPLHLRVQLLVLPDAEPHLPRWLLQPPKTMVASGRTNSAFVPIAGLMQRVSHFCLNPVSNVGNPTKEFQSG